LVLCHRIYFSDGITVAEQVEELIANLQKEKDELESQSKDLKKFTTADQKKRAIEFVLFDQELKAQKQKVSQVYLIWVV